MHIPLTRPYLKNREKEELAAVLDSGWLTQGPSVTKFENALASFIGVNHAVACSNCTTALHIALILKGITQGDEVIVPSYTWIATANAVRMVGAEPVFADIDLATFNIDPHSVEKQITSRTKAMMPVHQFGLPCDLEAIEKIAQKHHLEVIEDAACAVGSRYLGKPIGSRANIACFSFHPRKLITTGEGGMLVTNDEALAKRTRILINHGATVSDIAKHQAKSVASLRSEEFPVLGFNYRMTNLQGAVGAEQMKSLELVIRERAKRAARYTEAFSKSKDIIPPTIPSYATPNWQSYAIRVLKNRDQIAQKLLDADIQCRPAYMACHHEPFYKNPRYTGKLPNTDQALESVIILPLYPQMTEEEQEYVIKTLLEAVGR